ncbi:MotA/TolQ/ExbB proton channel family protein [Thermocrinis sp.]|jgi:biopolymer transport protein ExbB|uniref:MotA/TolQ/ExbB proton channel family protein n=1 Tax=Thermocrinis sp. TaxID=2024383 RepID=UPI002611F930|nr:MotA/TolQ/ExbB proton channel family protein [Thermocrinis sp.]
MMEGVFALLKTGGLAIYPLLLLSVISWAVALERLINLRSSNFLSKNLKDAKNLLRNGDLDGAIKLLSLDTSLGSKAILRVLEDFKSGKVPKNGLTEALRTEIDLLVPKVEKNLALLSTIASLSPLIGLFGTITGLIKVFNAFSINQFETALNLLASGIGEALVAAATGLAVAIPALFFYWVFRIWGSNLLNRLEEELLEFVRLLP